MYTLYFLMFEKYPELTKIGITKDIDKRVKQLSRIHGKVISGGWWQYSKRKEASIIEKRLHTLLNNFRVKVEGNGGTEFFDSYKSFPPNFNLSTYINFYTVIESGSIYE